MGAGYAAAGMAAASLAGNMMSSQAQYEASKGAYEGGMYNAYAGLLSNQAQANAAQAQAQMQASNYDAQADYYLRSAGNKQVQGRQLREMRLVKLGQDKGRIVSEAAGSGIGVSSRVVRKTLADTVKSARNDIGVMSRNEYEDVYGDMHNANVARINARNTRKVGAATASAYNAIGQMSYKAGVLGANASKVSAAQMWGNTIGGVTSAVGTGIGTYGAIKGWGS